jgi:hypothetical protein
MVLCFLLVRRRKIRKKKRGRKRSRWELFSQSQRLDTPCWLCQARFLKLLAAIKG